MLTHFKVAEREKSPVPKGHRRKAAARRLAEARFNPFIAVLGYFVPRDNAVAMKPPAANGSEFSSIRLGMHRELQQMACAICGLNIAVSVHPSHHEIAQLSPPLHHPSPEFCLYRTKGLQPSWVPTYPWPSPDIHPPPLAVAFGTGDRRNTGTRATRFSPFPCSTAELFWPKRSVAGN